MNKIMWKNVFRIASNVMLYAFLALCVLSLVLSVFMKKDADGAATVAGHQLRIIETDSMAKCEETNVSDYKIGSLPTHTMVLVKLVPQDPAAADAFYRDLAVGDVLTFRYVYHKQVTITHRITSITEKESGGFVIELLGDNVSSESDELYQIIDTSVPNNPNYIIGKVTASSFALGFASTLLKRPVGIVCIVIIPCLIIIALEIVKIVSVLGADKKRKTREEQAKRDAEIVALRAELAKLQQSTENDDPSVIAETAREEKGEEK